MKYKGVIPGGYELVKGQYGNYLRKLSGTKPVNKMLVRNSNKIVTVNRIAAAVQKGIAEERRYFYDGTLYNRLKSRLLKGSELEQTWWTKDWLQGFEVNDRHVLKTIVDFKSSYSFKKSVLNIELRQLFLTELTKRKGKRFNALRMHAVAVFIDEDKGEYTRYKSELHDLDLKSNSVVIEMMCNKKPKLPYILFIYGVGMEGKIVIESADATGMMVLGSGV